MTSRSIRPLAICFAIIAILSVISLGLSAQRVHVWISNAKHFDLANYGASPNVGFSIVQLILNLLSLISAIVLAIMLCSYRNEGHAGQSSQRSKNRIYHGLITQATVTFLNVILGIAHFAWYGNWLEQIYSELAQHVAAAEIAVWVFLCLAQIACVILLLLARQSVVAESHVDQQQIGESGTTKSAEIDPHTAHIALIIPESDEVKLEDGLDQGAAAALSTLSSTMKVNPNAVSKANVKTESSNPLLRHVPVV